MPDAPKIDSLDDFRGLLAALPEEHGASARAAEDREPQLTKPPGSLGRLEELSRWLAAWQGRHPPVMASPRACVFAANHGVAAQGVSAFPAEVTHQMVANFEAGGAAINQLCGVFGIDLEVFAMDLDNPTGDVTAVAAMIEADCVAALNRGLEAASRPADMLCLGEMGIANTTPAAALCLALYGGKAADWVGPGTGVSGDALDNKTTVVGDAVARHLAGQPDPIEILRRLGGREFAAIAGAVVGARLAQVPVMLDGFVCTAAAAVLEAAQPGALDHCRIAHMSGEPGHKALIERLGQRALLDMDMRLGEASGAALAVALAKAAVACHGGMATFAEAAVNDGGEG